MTRHPRSVATQRAETELRLAMDRIREKFKLTDVEYLGLVNEAARLEIGGLARSWLRQERHPDDPDTPADVE